MQYQQRFLDIISNPYELNEQSLVVLQKLSADFPYCQSLQVLLAKNLQQGANKLDFEKQVNKASAYAIDRRRFQRYISDRDKPIPVSEVKTADVILEKPEEEEVSVIIETDFHVFSVTHIDQPAAVIAEASVPLPFEVTIPVTTDVYFHNDTFENNIQSAEVFVSDPDFNPVVSDAEDTAITFDLPGPEPGVVKEQEQNDVESTGSSGKSETVSNGKITTTGRLLEIVKKRLREIRNRTQQEKPAQIQSPEPVYDLEQDKTVFALSKTEPLPDVAETVRDEKPDPKPVPILAIEPEQHLPPAESVELVTINVQPNITDSPAVFEPVKRTGFTEQEKRAKKPDINHLIEKFLKEEPRIKIKKELPEQQEDLSEASTKDNDNLVSETLAQIFHKQGKKDKALDIYEKLCLKYPEKSSYFAQKILAIKNDINT
jgi:hypothetical protein